MKRYISWVLIGLIGVVQTATARLGETPAECQRRYGEAVANYPGHADVAGVSVYVKDDISVTAIFTKNRVKGTRASMIIYSRLRPDRPRGLFLGPQIAENEQNAILGTVPGRWEDYDSKQGLTRTRKNLKRISTTPSMLIKHRNATAEAVKKAVRAVYAAHAKDPLVWPRTSPKNIAHNGPKVFAFDVLRGVGICSFDATKAITTWADQLASERANAKKPPAGKLPGF